MTNSSSMYLVELDRWGINNDGTNAVSTTKGINDAILWASQQGITTVTLPGGTYLIDENNPIDPQSFMTLDLGGSLLQIRTNGLENYQVVKFYQKVFSRVTNGIILGDKDTHDYYNKAEKWKPNHSYVINDTVIPTHTIADSSLHYYKCTVAGVSGSVEPQWKTSGQTADNGILWTAIARSTHEGGTGVNVNGGKFISIDNLDISNFTGDAINSGGDWGTLPYYLRASTNSKGGISPIDGSLTNEANRIRWSTKIPMSDPVISKFGTFGIYGSGYGFLGAEITATHYDLIFYNSNDSFHSARTKIQLFDDILVPAGASYAKVVLYQDTIPSDSGNQLWVGVNRGCEYVYFEKLKLHHCRRQGMSLAGKYIYVRDNEIHHIKGTAPQSGIDIEDGYDLNQHYYIERNHFHDNYGYNLVITNGKYMNIRNNRFNPVTGYVSTAINQPVDKSVFSGNILHQTQAVFAGELIISDNHFYGSIITIGDKSQETREMSISHCMFHDSQLIIDENSPYKIKVNGCTFKNDEEKKTTFNINYTLSLYSAPQLFSNCLFEGKDANYLVQNAAANSEGWIFNNNTFKNVSSGLASGLYTDCKFFNTPYNSFAASNTETEFSDCRFTTDELYSTNVPLFTVTNNLKSFKLKNCTLSHYGGTLLRVQNVIKEILIQGNKIEYTGNKETKSILLIEQSFTGDKLVVENNMFISSNLRETIENWSSQPLFIVRGNIHENTTLNLKDKEIKKDNIVGGITDPYYNRSSLPTTGYFKRGQEIKNTAPVPGGYIGWVSVIEGYATNLVWQPSKIYNKGDRISANGYVYESQTSGGMSSTISPNFVSVTTVGGVINDDNGMTSWKPSNVYSVGDLVVPQSSNGYYYKCNKSGTSGTTEPQWPRTIGQTINDGSVVWTTVRPIIAWKVIGKLAAFKPYGTIYN